MIKRNISESAIWKTIIYTNIIFFIISLILTGSDLKFDIHPFSALSPSNKSLVGLGASGTFSINNYHEWWSLITANFLHGSLIHILFNMLAVYQLAPLISKVYGQYRMFIIYIISGVFGFYLSYIAGIQITIGASGSICGLIGASFYFGKSRGGVFGRALYKQTVSWIIFIIIFGILVPNINNWGHGGGLISGIFLGMVLGYNDRIKENKFHKISALILALITLCVLIWSFIFYFKFFF
jgi:rhomboid protease GluP